MRIKKNQSILLFFILSLCLIVLTIFNNYSLAQTKNKRQIKSVWASKFYEKDVKYENFACNKEDSTLVSTYFKEYPVQDRFFPICHHDCPVIKTRPVIPFPPPAKAAKVKGTVSVHVLVDEKGKVLYARVLSGNQLLHSAARLGACETQFEEYPNNKHEGLMHFTVDDYKFLGVPSVANEIW